MDQIDSENNRSDEPIVRLTEGLTMKDLLSQGGATFKVNFDDIDEEVEQLCYDPEEVYTHLNPSCGDLLDESSYADGECEPFEMISKKMTDVTEDGKIKKEVIRKGHGNELPENSTVTIQYDAYLEYNDEPFDSTYIRKKPLTFCLGRGETIPGIDIAVQSMKLDEKSRFLIHYDLAYGKLGCLQRVPPESSVLFEIELKNCVNTAPAGTYEELSDEQQKTFNEIYKYCLALCSKGNDFFTKGNYKCAAREYNMAITKLEFSQLKDSEEEGRQQKLLLRILTNAVVAYTKMQEPKRACFHANKIFNMCKGTSLRVPTKVYFSKPRCLIQLDDLGMAERLLKEAKRLEPQNLEITKELIKLEAKKKESRNLEIKMANKMLGTDKVLDDFKDAVKNYCEDLLKNKSVTEYKVPGKLTKRELEFVREESKKQGLELRIIDENQECFIFKNK